MTRSHKFNDKAHVAQSEEGTYVPVEHVPKFFGKHGFPDADPKKIKKNGGGKSNWYVALPYLIPCVSPRINTTPNRGNAGDEVLDDPEFSFVNARRHSNASAISNNLDHFKSKFEVNEPEPVFEEGVHDAPEEDHVTLQKTDTSSSGGSVDDERKVTRD